ncbi:hypothetical protein BDN70DRAFT_871145 [Pholiota conissans]|uniref:F-box domain-containing protein n=1 Tax=Pholiota conissans TaxID=109636 RepID=A0A9P5ZDL1_9AGAR|nr:hypothetical protein BDN70DRAFT_871145 [Pholiota conissans]
MQSQWTSDYKAQKIHYVAHTTGSLALDPNGADLSLSIGNRKVFEASIVALFCFTFRTLSSTMSTHRQYEALLPDDILWEIISQMWHSSMTPRKRVDFMESSLQINRLWMNMFTRIAYRDVYITSKIHLNRYLRILRRENPIYLPFKDLLNTMCRTITFEIEPHDKTADVMADLLYMVKATNVLPNLHTLILRYDAFSYCDVTRDYQFVDLPKRIQKLEIHFRTTPSASSWNTINQLEESDPPWYLPHLRRLAIFGAKDYQDIVSCYLLSCPQLHTLEIDFLVQNPRQLHLKRHSTSFLYSK